MTKLDELRAAYVAATEVWVDAVVRKAPPEEIRAAKAAKEAAYRAASAELRRPGRTA